MTTEQTNLACELVLAFVVFGLMLTAYFTRPRKPVDTEMDRINADIAEARKRHAPVAGLMRAKSALIHGRLRRRAF